MAVQRLGLCPRKHGGDSLGQPNGRPSGRDAHRENVSFAFEVGRYDSSTGHRARYDEAKIEKELDLVLRREPPRNLPIEAGAVGADKSARSGLGVAGVDRCGQRARGAKGEAAELNPRRGGHGALPDQIHGDSAHLGVVIAIEYFEAVDDRADRADDVMTDPRAK